MFKRAPSKLFALDLLRNRMSAVVGVAASAVFLSGCQTTTQVPVVCSKAEIAKRDPKCKPVAARTPSAAVPASSSREY